MGKINKNSIVLKDKVYISDIYITKADTLQSTPLGSFKHSFKAFPSDFEILSIYKTKNVTGNKVGEILAYNDGTLLDCIKNISALVIKDTNDKRYFITVNNIRELN